MPFRVHLLRQEPNQGITNALNAGLSLIAQGGYQYVARLDACDLALPGRFAAQMEFLDSRPRHAAVGTAARYVDTQGNLLFTYRPPLDHDALMRLYHYRSGLVHPSVMMRTEALLACGFYRNEFPGGEDYDLFMRFAKAYKLANLGAVWTVKEISPGSITSRRLPVALTRIRLLLAYFDPWSVHSYIGLAINAALILAPRSLMVRLRRFVRSDELA
jgi:glycosyltransferase involved in cell wall biosynthesis